MSTAHFICGALEGFYGRPWNHHQRIQLFQWLQDWEGMNTYMYAPKDDVYHRSQWRKLYPKDKVNELESLIQSCKLKSIDFIYAIAPGLDITYSNKSDWKSLYNKIEQIQNLGCTHFAILFDDIPPKLSGVDNPVFSSFAEAQTHITNRLYSELNESTLIFCPTVYCGQMAIDNIKGNDYLNELGENLDPNIDFFWTGPKVVSNHISVESIKELSSVIKRKPILWDNLHANDYDMQQIFFGPYVGRPLELKMEIKGILSNPNCQFWANYNPLRTLSFFTVETDTWNPEQALIDSTKEWLHYFGHDEILLDEILVLSECFSAPGHKGTRGNQLTKSIKTMLSKPPQEWGPQLGIFKKIELTINSICKKLAESSNRDLLYDIYSHIWELRDALGIVSHWITVKESGKGEFSPQVSIPRGTGFLNELHKYIHSKILT